MVFTIHDLQDAADAINRYAVAFTGPIERIYRELKIESEQEPDEPKAR
jgi:hypothetical protein